MNVNDNIEKIDSEITLIIRDNLKLKNKIDEIILENERFIDELICSFIKIIDSYDKAEAVIRERGLDSDENAQKAIKRMLQPKRVAMTILEMYNVHKIELLGQMVNEDLCTIVETEPDLEKSDGIVLSIEKDGYIRNDRLIRRAEVIIVRN